MTASTTATATATATTATQTAHPVRATLDLDGRALSYLDFGGTGRPLLALHGHLSEGSSFCALAAALGPGWRVIAPDQRGHGDSDRASDYTRAGYVADLRALVDHLGLDRFTLLGHSLGAVNAFHLAAELPHRVEALVNLDTAADIPRADTSPLAFVLSFPYTADSREELLSALGPAAPLLGGALRPLPGGGWRLPFHPQDTVTSENAVHGDHWQQWLAGDCPALLLHGTSSQVLGAELAAEMVARRPRTTYAALDADHFLQLRDPEGVHAAVRSFLAGAGR
ncbi:alpha/beta hydrolase [Streptomyces sp. NPDC006326]|uniref:alpha/beta fold hydrolase n=1 Tax=Streptomyces sp. NPDC006326 TaxID=3156752 RepID=UPI0033BDB027